MKVIKRNGAEVDFSREKIYKAIKSANEEVRSFDEKDAASDATINTIATRLYERCRKRTRATSVEEIQDMIETELMKEHAYETAKRYIRYRYWRSQVRQRNTTDDQILALIENDNEEVKQENSNKNPTVVSVQRDYMAGEVSKDLTKRFLLPADVMKAHEEGLIHFHDADYFAQHMHNCDLINLEDMLQNGTVISGTMIEKPHSFSTACNIATQIIAQVASSQYGGQSISLTHLAPFVDVSRHKIRAEVEEELSGLREYESFSGYQEMIDAEIEEIVEKRVREEIKRGVQTIQYQVVTLMTTNGQAPFITVFMYLGEAKDEQTKKDLALIIEEVLLQRYRGVKNEAGAWVTPAFPKLIYVLEEQNVHKESEYYYLTKLSAMCTAKRMVPDYISEKIMLQNKIDKNGNGNCYTCMGCRSFLTPYVDEDGNPKYYGRFNQGVVTINLVDIGLSAKGDMNKFWELFDERLELCHKALQYRHERLTGTKSDAAPILWQYGALTRLKKGETIDKYLHGGYSTLSLGYAGLWECVYALNGKKLTEREGEALGLTIMRKLNEYTAKWKKAENIDYSLYGTPLESTTYKFAKCLQKRFGTIKGVTDKNYITNSYHVHVTEPIDAFEKLALEAKFQALSPGGAISYVEVPNMQDNLEAVLEIMHFIYDHIMYAELNTKSDFCQECGYDGEIQIVENEDKKLIWQCPNCGNTDQSKMNVARRTCGYIGSQFWNQGRTQEIRERVMHVD
jgi:ribonucleoside-triphosphate reductase